MCGWLGCATLLLHSLCPACALHGSLLWSCSACTPALTSSAGQRGRRSGSERAHAGGPAAAPAAGQHPLCGAPSEGVLCWVGEGEGWRVQGRASPLGTCRALAKCCAGAADVLPAKLDVSAWRRIANLPPSRFTGGGPHTDGRVPRAAQRAAHQFCAAGAGGGSKQRRAALALLPCI